MTWLHKLPRSANTRKRNCKIAHHRRRRSFVEALEFRELLTAVPQPAHVVIVMEENHAYSQIIGQSDATYINKTLAQGGALMTNSFAIEHPSEPNYLDFFSGSNQGITNDNLPIQFPGVTLPFTTANLGSELMQAGLSFTSYSESLPSAGYDSLDTSTQGNSGEYARRHNPAVNWTDPNNPNGNIGSGGNVMPTSVNQPFTSFPTDFNQLPTVSLVVPNVADDMHDDPSPTGITKADTWLQTNIGAYAQWAQQHNSLLIVTWDEDDQTAVNQIPTIFYGEMVKPGQYNEQINHYSVLRTVEDMYSLPHASSSAQATSITDVWMPPVAATGLTLTSAGGTAVNGTLATFTDSDGNTDTTKYSATIDWGDKSPLVTVSGSSISETGGTFSVTGSHTYAQEGVYSLTLTVTDSDGATATASPVVTADFPLHGTASPVSATEASTFSGTVATLTDDDSTAAAGDYKATIDWGDKSALSTVSGSSFTSAGITFNVPGSHVYAEEGTFTMTVTISDVGGATATVNPQAVVADAPLSGTSASIASSTSVSGTVASFSDPDTADTVGDYSASINWGDGNTTNGSIAATGTLGQFNVAGSHNYANGAAHTITVTVSHGTDQPSIVHSVEPGGIFAAEHIYVIGSGTITVSATNGLLTNDSGPSALTVTAGTVAGANGSFTFNADGSFTYTPAASFPGYDSAQYTVTDVAGDKATATVNVLSQHAAVVWKFYEAVLNREPDPGGLQYWTNYFNNGGSTGDMAFGFFESDELLNEVLGNYYLQYLLRPLDAAGLAYWKGVWHATGGPEQIKAGFADSPEFYNSAGATPQSWLTALYQRILNRTPDSAGLSFWENFYQQQTAAGVDAGTIRYEIALGFFDSPEAYGNDVAGWFQEYLFRAPTDAEKAQYANQMQSGASDRTIEQEIANLPEYANNPPAPPAGTATVLPNFYQKTI